MASDGKEGKKLTPTEQAIIEMMTKQNLQASQLQTAGAQEGVDQGERKHTFWNTQVRFESQTPTRRPNNLLGTHRFTLLLDITAYATRGTK